MKTNTLWTALLLCACATPGAKPGDMSRSGHEAAAQEEERLATGHESQYDPGGLGMGPPCPTAVRSGYDACWSSVVNPTEKHRNQADRHRKYAANHRAASVALREAEARACGGLAEGDKEMSPFEHTEDIASVGKLFDPPSGGRTPTQRFTGATVTFRAVQGMTAEWLQRVVDCHLARNASLGHDVPEMPDCPLVPKGVEAQVSSTGSGFAVKVRSDDPLTAEEIYARAQRLVGIVPRAETH